MSRVSEQYSKIQELLVEASDWHTGWVLPWSTDTTAALAQVRREAKIEALREAIEKYQNDPKIRSGFSEPSFIPWAEKCIQELEQEGKNDER